MSRKVGKLGEERIPMVRDLATWIFLENPENPGWPEHPVTCILADLAWMLETTEVELVDLRPEFSQMGNETLYRVLVNRVVVQQHSGKYGQVHRRVLLERVPTDEDLTAFVKDTL